MPDDELGLWNRCRKGDEAAREELILRYLERTRAFADTLAKTIRWVEQKDLRHLAFEGLIRGVDHFDPKRGFQFWSYAPYRIRERIFASPEVSRVPRDLIKHNRLVRRTHDELMQRLQRQPTVEEIAQAAGMAVEAIEASLRAISIAFPGSLEDPGVAPDQTHDSEQRALAALQAEEVLRKLPERARRVVILTFWEGKSDKEIGQILNLEPNHVKQIRYRALRGFGE